MPSSFGMDITPYYGRMITGRKRGEESPVQQSVYAQVGDALHKVVQSEMALRGNLLGAEVALIDPANKFVGRIDAVSASGEVIEIKSIGLQELLTLTEPRPEHKWQLGYYLGATGKPSGKLLYVAREAPYIRRSFDVQGTPELYEIGKAHILSRRDNPYSSDRQFAHSLQTALEDQPSNTGLAQGYVEAYKEYKFLKHRMEAQEQRRAKQRSLIMAQMGGEKAVSNTLEGLRESGYAAPLRQETTPFGSPSHFYFLDPYLLDLFEKASYLPDTGFLEKLTTSIQNNPDYSPKAKEEALKKIQTLKSMSPEALRNYVDPKSTDVLSPDQMRQAVKERRAKLFKGEASASPYELFAGLPTKAQRIEAARQYNAALDTKRSKKMKRADRVALYLQKGEESAQRRLATLQRALDQQKRAPYMSTTEEKSIRAQKKILEHIAEKQSLQRQEMIAENTPVMDRYLKKDLPVVEKSNPISEALQAEVISDSKVHLTNAEKAIKARLDFDESKAAEWTKFYQAKDNIDAKNIKETFKDLRITAAGKELVTRDMVHSGIFRKQGGINRVMEVWLDIETGIPVKQNIGPHAIAPRMWSAAVMTRSVEQIEGEVTTAKANEVLRKAWKGANHKELVAAHLDIKALDAIKEAKNIQSLVSGGFLDRADIPMLRRMAHDHGFKQILPFLQEDAAAYEKVIRGDGADTAYQRIQGMVEAGRMKTTQSIGGAYKSEQRMLQDLADYLIQVGEANKLPDTRIALKGHNIAAFDLPTFYKRAKSLGVEHIDEVRMLYGDVIEDTMTGPVVQRLHELNRKIELKGTAEIAHIADMVPNFQAQLPTMSVRINAMATAFKVAPEELLKKLEHTPGVDNMLAALIQDSASAGVNEEQLAAQLRAHFVLEQRGEKYKLKEFSSRVYQGAGVPSTVEDVMEITTGRAKGSITNLADSVTEVIDKNRVMYDGADNLIARKPVTGRMLSAVSHVVERATDKIAGPGSFVEGVALAKEGAGYADDLFASIHKKIGRVVESIAGPSAKELKMNPGRLGLIGVGVLAAGALVFSTKPAPSFSNEPFRSPPPVLPARPSGNDEPYKLTVEFGNKGKELRKLKAQLTDFGSGYQGMHGSVLGLMASQGSLPNLTNLHMEMPGQVTAQSQQHSRSRMEEGPALDMGSREPRIYQDSVEYGPMITNQFDKTPLHTDQQSFKRKARFRSLSSQGSLPLFDMNSRAVGHRRTGNHAFLPLWN